MVVASLTALSDMGSFLLELSVPIHCNETLFKLRLTLHVWHGNVTLLKFKGAHIFSIK